MISIYDVLKASKGIHVDDTFAELWGRKLSNAYTVATYTGTLPATLKTVEGYLESYKIYGNTEQNSTPTPENPIMPIGCGERVDIAGLSEPLCGIQTYIDSLNLSTGTLTRRIKKLVLTGKENWSQFGDGNIYIALSPNKSVAWTRVLSTHFKPSQIQTNGSLLWFVNADVDLDTVDEYKQYLAAQHAAGTPVTVWYVLAALEISTIPVPSGLTGTIDGYLIQDGTPAPETPIYPTANGVKQADGTYSIPYGYKLPLAVNGVEYPIYLGDAQLAKDEYVDSETGKIYHNVGGELTPIDPPAPFPRIPTVAGTTIIDYDGTPKPEKVELTYRKRKGQ